LQITFAVTCYHLVGYGFFNIFNLSAKTQKATSTPHIHQSIEMSNIADIRATIDLLTKAVLEIDGYDWSFR
jgi:hypothetical protein